ILISSDSEGVQLFEKISKNTVDNEILNEIDSFIEKIKENNKNLKDYTTEVFLEDVSIFNNLKFKLDTLKNLYSVIKKIKTSNSLEYLNLIPSDRLEDAKKITPSNFKNDIKSQFYLDNRQLKAVMLINTYKGSSGHATLL